MPWEEEDADAHSLRPHALNKRYLQEASSAQAYLLLQDQDNLTCGAYDPPSLCGTQDLTLSTPSSLIA
jgi:hypothetical protein